LTALKGEGGAAALLSLCDVAELPLTITAFLDQVYAQSTMPPSSTESQAMIAASPPTAEPVVED
jgi:hypothetical protein